MQKVRYYLSFNSLRIKFQYLFQIFDGPINSIYLKAVRELGISPRDNKTLPCLKVQYQLKSQALGNLRKGLSVKCFLNTIFLQDWRKKLRLSKQLLKKQLYFLDDYLWL